MVFYPPNWNVFRNIFRRKKIAGNFEILFETYFGCAMGGEAGRSQKWSNGALSLTYHPTKGRTVWSSWWLPSWVQGLRWWCERLGWRHRGCSRRAVSSPGATWKLPRAVGPCGRRLQWDPVRGKQDNRASPGVSLALCAPRDTCTSPSSVYVHSEMLQWVRGCRAPGKREKGSVFIATGALLGETKHRSSISQHTHGKIVKKPHVTLAVLESFYSVLLS